MRLEINVNWSNKFSEKDILKIVDLIEKSRLNKIWVGDFHLFRNPIDLVKLIEENFSIEVGLIVKPQKAMIFAKKYDVCLIPGNSGKEAVKEVLKRLEKLKRENVCKIYVGCSGRIMAKKAFNVHNKIGIMPNYVKKEFVEWLIQDLDWVEVLPIGPSLILPSDKKDELLIAAILVALSNQSFAKSFGFDKEYNDLSSVDVYGMIANSRLYRNEAINKLEKFLLNNFTVSGSIVDVAKKIKSLSKFDGFILADPFFRDLKSLIKLKELKKLLLTVKT